MILKEGLDLVLLCLLTIPLRGQAGSPRWSFRSNAGTAFPLAKLKSGAITDQLIDYDDQYFYWQFAALEYYFKNNLAVCLMLQGHSFTDPKERGKRMDAVLRERFGDDYFISTSPYSFGDRLNMNANLYLGVAYAKRFRRFSLIPKVQLGFTSFFANTLNVYLKERNTNNRLQVVYDFSTLRRPQDNFTLLAGLLSEFNLSPTISLDLNLQTYFFKTRFDYEEEIRDTYTEERIRRSIDYQKVVGTLSLGLGIAYHL
ncbi:MAG: hypothetical protein AAGJ93_15590 [Bacteroidota bacterium]